MEILPYNNIIENQKDPSIIQKKIENVKEYDKDLMDACKEFESIFLHMMLKEMKKTVPDEGIIEKSQGTLVFEDMHLEELSKEMSKGDNGLGIAKILYEQFRGGRARL